jgi:hypothetical protein
LDRTFPRHAENRNPESCGKQTAFDLRGAERITCEELCLQSWVVRKYGNTTASNNTANGAFALFSNTTGGKNTAYGYEALEHSTDSNNIAVGSSAGLNLTSGSNNIDIGNNGVAGESAKIRIGKQGRRMARSLPVLGAQPLQEA